MSENSVGRFSLVFKILMIPILSRTKAQLEKDVKAFGGQILMCLSSEAPPTLVVSDQQMAVAMEKYADPVHQLSAQVLFKLYIICLLGPQLLIFSINIRAQSV